MSEEELTDEEIQEIRRLVAERMSKIEFILEEGPNGEVFITMKGDDSE